MVWVKSRDPWLPQTTRQNLLYLQLTLQSQHAPIWIRQLWFCCVQSHAPADFFFYLRKCTEEKRRVLWLDVVVLVFRSWLSRYRYRAPGISKAKLTLPCVYEAYTAHSKPVEQTWSVYEAYIYIIPNQKSNNDFTVCAQGIWLCISSCFLFL